MKYNKFDILKPVTAAIGFGLAVAASPASATITFGNPFTLFEDDNVDFLIDNVADPNNQIGIVDAGDTFVSIAEVNFAGNNQIGPTQELTAVAILNIVGFANLDGLAGSIPNDIIFGPVANFSTGIPGFTIPLIDKTGVNRVFPGAMIAFWHDDPVVPSLDLRIGAGDIVNGTPSCTTLATCLPQATNGMLWQVDGFEEGTRGAVDNDEYFFALNAQTSTAVIDPAPPSTVFGGFNAGLSILYNGTGQNLVNDMLDCGAVATLTGNFYCSGPPTPGSNGMVDFLGSGSILGGGEGFTASEWFATSDFDFIKKRSVPEPGTLVLMVTGLLGVGASIRIRRRG